MKKNIWLFIGGGALVAATAIPIAGMVVSCSSTPATDTFKSSSGVVGNGITTSGFKDVVSKLNLSNTTALSSLTDATLKNALSNTEYKDLTLTIQDGSSEVDGILKLKINGTYNGKNYNDDIIISNFNHLNGSFTVTDVKLNNDMWFQKGGAYSGGSQKVDFGEENISLIEDATFTCDNSKLKWEDVKKDYNITLASGWNISQAKDKLENVKFTIAHTKKEYKNGKWDVSDKKLEQKGSATISLPSFNDLLENVLDNVKFNDVSQYYASYFRGLFSYIAKQSRNDILEEASKKLFSSDINYSKNYDELKNVKIIFSTDPNDYSADDVKGEFTLKKVKLSLNNSETKMRDISWDKFKKIPEKFQRRYNKEITISNKNISSENKANYLWRLLGKALEDEIILVYNGKSETDNNLLTSDALKQKIIPTVSGNWWPKSCIYDSARPELVNSVGFDRVNKNFDNFSLLGSSGRMEFGRFNANVTSNKFDYDSGLLNFEKGIIQVESINLWANEMKNVRLAKTNDNSGSVELSFEVPIVITLVNNPNKIYQTTTFKTTFL